MKQEGTENKLNLEEKGYLTTGGSMSDIVDKTETILIIEGKMLSETPTKAETVVRVAGMALNEVASMAEAVVITHV